jgi:hypothetical protein
MQAAAAASFCCNFFTLSIELSSLSFAVAPMVSWVLPCWVSDTETLTALAGILTVLLAGVKPSPLTPLYFTAIAKINRPRTTPCYTRKALGIEESKTSRQTTLLAHGFESDLQASWTATGRKRGETPTPDCNRNEEAKKLLNASSAIERTDDETSPEMKTSLLQLQMQTTTTKTHEPNNNKRITSSSQFHKGGKGTYVLAPKFNNYFRKQIFDKNRNSINSLATSLPHYSEEKTKKQKQKKEKIPRITSVQNLTPQSLESPSHIKTQNPQNRQHMHTNKQSKTKQTSKQAQTPYLQLQNNFQLKKNNNNNNNYYYYYSSVSTTHNAQMQTKSSSPP